MSEFKVGYYVFWLEAYNSGPGKPFCIDDLAIKHGKITEITPEGFRVDNLEGIQPQKLFYPSIDKCIFGFIDHLERMIDEGGGR